MLEAEIWSMAETEDGYVIFIKPLQSDCSVPLFIGRPEAQAILVGFGGTGVVRPLMADVFLNLIKSADMEFLRIEINDLKDDTFFANIVLKKSSGETLILDARPSDALALAVRCSRAVYIDEKVVETAGIPDDGLVPETDGSSDMLRLQRELEETLKTENYERAAEIRNMLQSLEP